MGLNQSKSNEEHDFERKSFHRFSGNRKSAQSTTDQIENISRVTSNLRNEIGRFLGDRNSSRYKEFQKILTTQATELQKLKNKSKKPPQRDRCDEVQGQIQSCLKVLETKVTLNEETENLDLGAVESNSFITHGFTTKPRVELNNQKLTDEVTITNKNRVVKAGYTRPFDRIEEDTQNMERDIRNAIELQDSKQLIIYECKIKILYDDLEMTKVDDHTPLADKKAGIGKRLIRCNNQIKGFRKNSDKINKETIQDKGEPKPENELNRIDRSLSDLEVQALVFEGIKGDKRYKELKQILENHWTTVYSLDLLEDEERKRKSVAIERIKNIMQELKKRADVNEKQTNALKDIQKLNQELRNTKKDVEHFHGTSTDATYLKLDQELRGLWGRFGAIEEPNEHIRRTKEKIISEIQQILKDLSQKAKNRESQIYENAKILKQTKNDEEEILQKQLIKQVEEFENHWNQLNYNLEVQKITKSEYSTVIIEKLEKILDSIHQKQNALSIIEKRKSTGSLVVAKVINNTDKLMKIQKESTSVNYNDSIDNLSYQSYYQPPDLLQQQAVHIPALIKNGDSEIKVQPNVKTIGEMQRIGTEAKSLLQQIRQSNCLRNDTEYKMFEIKLQQCRANLDSVEYNKRSETIESNRRRASKTINEGFKALEEKLTLRQDVIRSSRAQDFMDIDAEIQYFRQQIKNFNSVVKDKQYEKIKQGLADCLNKLQIIDDMHISKQDSIRQIQQYHQELETKLAENQAKVKISEKNSEIKRQTSQDIKAIIEQVQKLKLQIERFSGVHDGLHFKQIEGNLKTYMERLDAVDDRGDEKLQNAISLTKQKIQKYLRILADKSAKPVQQEVHTEHVVKEIVDPQKENSVLIGSSPSKSKLQRQSQVDPDSPHHKINSLRDKLVEIKDQTETFAGKYNDETYQEIEKQLLICFDELKGINDRGHNSVIISKEQYADYIEKLMEYFADKAKIQDEVAKKIPSETDNVIKINNQIQLKQSNQTFKIVDPTEELSAIEEEITQFKRIINSFIGTTESDNYKKLNQDISDQITKLENVQAGNVAHVREMKRKLVLELQDCMKLLEEKGNFIPAVTYTVQEQAQMKKFSDILEEVEEIAKEVDAFNGVKNDDDYCYLDEMLIRLTIKLDNTETFGKADLRNSRKKVIQEIHKNMKILAQKIAEKEISEKGVTV